MNLKDLFSITPLWREASIICWTIPSRPCLLYHGTAAVEVSRVIVLEVRTFK